jgi:hypothetical protein
MRVSRLLGVSGAFLCEFVDEMFAAYVLRTREVFDHSDCELNGRMFYHGGVLHDQGERFGRPHDGASKQLQNRWVVRSLETEFIFSRGLVCQ